MNRSTRTLIVVAIAVGLAGGATYLVYRTITNRPTKVVEVATAYAVVAAHPISVGTRIAAGDVKLVPWPAANPVPGGFTTTESVIDRGVVSAVAENEPLSGNNVASKDAGAGLPPTIPQGMRAISVKVNEVVGVAGFVVPGTRVDVMVILREQQGGMARVVVSNVQVLAAGTKYDQDMAKEGKAVPSSVVTLLVSPEDAERVGLAGSEGQVMLTLRNPLDSAPTTSTGTRTVSLTGGYVAPAPAKAPAAPTTSGSNRRAAAPPPSPAVATPTPPPPPAPFQVQTIKGGTTSSQIIKKEEIIK